MRAIAFAIVFGTTLIYDAIRHDRMDADERRGVTAIIAASFAFLCLCLGAGW